MEQKVAIDWNKVHKVTYEGIGQNGCPIKFTTHFILPEDNPELDVEFKHGELIFVNDYLSNNPFEWHYNQFDRNSENYIIDSYGDKWIFCIRFKDFDPDDMKTTLSKAYVVDNHKIVKYKYTI